MTANLDLIKGRNLVMQLTNKSGGSLAQGDVVIVDTSNNEACTTTTSGRAEVSVGVVLEVNGIANNAAGRVLVAGYAPLVNVPASVTRGHYVETHTVAKQATGNSARRSGSFGQFLTGGTTPTAWLWGQTDQSASGLTSPLTTKGDLWGYDSVNNRIPVGSNGQVLTADSTQSLGLKWAAAGGGSFAYPLESAAVDGTYGDDFTGSSLAGIWTRRNLASSNESYQQGPAASKMTVDLTASGGGGTGTTSDRMYLQSCPAGDWEIMMAAQYYIPDLAVGGAGSSTMMGLVVVSSSGTGVGLTPYHNGEIMWLVNLSTYAYTSSLNSVNLTGIVPHYKNGKKIWLRLKKASGVYTGYWSLDGELWAPVRSPTGTPSAFTPDRFGFGRFYVDGSGATEERLVVDRFDKIA